MTYCHDGGVFKPSRPHKSRDRVIAGSAGFALLLVIWVLALLSVIAAGLAADTRSENQAARTMVALARARAAADAGITLAILDLINPMSAAQSPGDGRDRTMRYDDHDITIVVEDEGGKIDLNAAPPELIAGLVNELGGDSDLRSQVIDGILQRRQDFPTGVVADNSSAVLGRLRTLPLGGLPFAAVSELRLVNGMSDTLYARLRPYLTVYTQSATINAATAQRATLLAVPGMDPQEVDRYLAARADIANGPGDAPPSLSAGRNLLAAKPVSAATIIATATDETGVTFARAAVVALSPETPLRPYTILQWAHPVEDDTPKGQAGE